MKETTTINISGIIFHIDQDAFFILQKYFVELKKRFGNDDEGKEIINDIELRIAEILQETLTERKQVITRDDVQQVIETMGHPEDIETDEEPYQQRRNECNNQRRIFRDTDNMVFGGVCSGIGHYFGCDPVIVRVVTVFLSLFYGVGLLIYAVMWAFVPKAITTSQKLEMRGEPVNAKNIKRTITENYEDLKNSKNYQKTRDSVNLGISAIGKIIKFVVKAIGIIIGIGLLIGTVTILVAFANVYLFHTPNVYIDGQQHVIFYPFLESIFGSESAMLLFVVSVILLTIIPIGLILFVGVKLVFKFNTNNKAIGLTALVAWLIALIVVISIAISMGLSFANEAESAEQHRLTMPAHKTLYVDLKEMNIHFEKKWASYRIAHDSELKQSYIYDRPDFDVKRSNTGMFELEVEKSARSNNFKSALSIAESIRYQFEQKDSILLLSPWYEANFKHAEHINEVDVTLYVPDGYSVFFYKEIYPIVDDIKNVSNTSDSKMMGKKWTMTPEGLVSRHNR